MSAGQICASEYTASFEEALCSALCGSATLMAFTFSVSCVLGVLRGPLKVPHRV